jgi:tRNA(Ile2) C34 agmatinyltransferase TiaS
MSQQTIVIQKPRCPQCGQPVKQSSHTGDLRYFKCPCGNRFKGVVK